MCLKKVISLSLSLLGLRSGSSKLTILAIEVNHRMTIKYLKCRGDHNFEVEFGVNGAIGTIVTKWDLILIG